MSVQYRARLEDGYIRIITTGVLVTLDDICRYGTFMYNQAISLNTPRILLDEKNMTDSAEASTIYQWSEHDIVAKTAIAGIRIAGISTPENYDVNRIYETMFQNRSYNFRVFLDEPEAIAWLKS